VPQANRNPGRQQPGQHSRHHNASIQVTHCVPKGKRYQSHKIRPSSIIIHVFYCTSKRMKKPAPIQEKYDIMLLSAMQ
jgi:hypothetical protein